MSDEQLEDTAKEIVDSARLDEQGAGVNSAPGGYVDPEGMYDDANYIPDFIQEMFDDPPILPTEDKDAFQFMFDSFEMGVHRPKTDLEYWFVFSATVAMWELMRYERMKAAIVGSERRMAVETLHRQVAAGMEEDKDRAAMRQLVRQNTLRFFTDPDYRKTFLEDLERAGFGVRAVDAMAFMRALPSLATINGLIKTAEKRLANCFKQLNLAYEMRGAEDPMPRSLAAARAEDLAQRKAKETREKGPGA